MTRVDDPEPRARHARRAPVATAVGTLALVLALVALVSTVGGTAARPLSDLLGLEADVRTGEPVPSSPPTTLPGPRPGAAVPDPRATTAAVRSEPTDPDGWRLVASDGFDGTGLDPEHWFPYTGDTSEGVGQHLASNLSVADGVLTVTSRGTTSGGASWAPGQLYGRWEFRARADPATGYSPVVLLWPDAEDWPEGGEVNIMEIPAPDRLQSHFTVHHGEDNSTVSTSVDGDFSRWSTFTAEWTPDHVAGFVDGREVFRTTDPETIPPRPMHLAFQQDVGPFGIDWVPAPDETTPAEARLQIDWVRIYTMADPPQPRSVR